MSIDGLGASSPILGAVTEFIGLSTGISATPEAARQRDLLAEIFESTTDAVAIANADMIRVYANRAYRTMMGFEFEVPLKDLPPIEAIHLDPAGLRNQIALCKQHGTTTWETAIRGPGGRETPVSQVVIAHRDSQGKISHYSTIIRDVSERNALTAQLHHAQKMEAIGRLAGGVAHDFNNLLTVLKIAGGRLADLLPEGSAGRAEADEICHATDRASELTGQLLSFSRGYDHPVHFVDAFDQLRRIDNLVKTLGGPHVKASVEVACGSAMVRESPGQIEQVLVNLVVNACDAMAGRGRLGVLARRDHVAGNQARVLGLAAGDYAVIEVSDEGSGMDPATRARIFEPFFTTKANGKGTGLGLTIAYGIVTRWGGTILANSSPGEGSCFTIYWPVVVEPASAGQQGAAARGPLGAGETVLVVDDHDGVRLWSAGSLETAGYRTLEARSGEEALQFSESFGGPIHLVVADVVMPGIDGFELARRLRAVRPETAILFISGLSEEPRPHEADRPANFRLLQKPFPTAELLRQVREALDGKARDPDRTCDKDL